MNIGRRTDLLVDDRKEPYYSQEPNRRIPVSFFYPTAEIGESFYKDLYAPKEEMLVKIYAEGKPERKERLATFPAAFLNGAEPMGGQAYPVIVFSHGLEADRDFYLFLIEPLVKAGYLVVTLGHLYDTDVTLLPDGELVRMKQGLLAESSYEERRQQIEIRGRDMKFVLDRLKDFNQSGFLKGLMDLDRVAICGHSLGGMTCLEALDHPLVKSAVLLDAALAYTDLAPALALNQTVEKPVLNFRRDGIDYAQRLKPRIERLKDKSAESFKKAIIKEHEAVIQDEVATRQLFEYVKGDRRHFITMDKTVHMSFCDWFLLVPDEYYPSLMPIEEAHAIMVETILAFYKENLLGQGKPYTDLIDSNKLPVLRPEPIN